MAKNINCFSCATPYPALHSAQQSMNYPIPHCSPKYSYHSHSLPPLPAHLHFPPTQIPRLDGASHNHKQPQRYLCNRSIPFTVQRPSLNYSFPFRPPQSFKRSSKNSPKRHLTAMLMRPEKAM